MTEDVTYEQMKASIGTLIILWSRIERAGRKEVTRANDGVFPKSAHGIAATLKAWETSVHSAENAAPLRTLLASTLRSQLKGPLDIRNGVCHGIVRLSATIYDEPATLFWELNGIEGTLTWSEIQKMFRWLSKVRFAIGVISNTSADGLGNRIADITENREWWTSEYGVAFPETTRARAP